MDKDTPDKILSAWGQFIRRQNWFQCKLSTRSNFNLIGCNYKPKGVNEDDARDRADSMRYKMDMDKVSDAVDGLPKDTIRIIMIRFVESHNPKQGLHLYRGYRGKRARHDQYKLEISQSIRSFEVAYQ